MNGGVVVAQTVGERIDELTQEYIGIYERMKTDPVLSDRAEGIALHDPVLKRFIWRSVEEKVQAHIEEAKNV
jgi:hypothetical protein